MREYCYGLVATRVSGRQVSGHTGVARYNAEEEGVVVVVVGKLREGRG